MNRFLIMVPTVLAMLRRQKFIHLMLLAEIAVLTALIVNALAVVAATQQRWQTPTGVDEANIGVIRSIGVVGAANPSTAAQNLQLLREIPDVRSAAYGAPPLMNTSTIDVRRDAGARSATTRAYLFQGSQGLTATLGIDVVAGRTFTSDDPPPAGTLDDNSVLPVLITRKLSQRLFPDSDALGKVVYTNGNPMRVIGIVRYLRSQLTGADNDDMGVVSEIRIENENVGGAFTIRAKNGSLGRALPAAAALMEQHNTGHVQADVFTLTGKRLEYFASDMAVSRMLLTVIIVLIVMLACGLAGLTHFLVNKRQRQIGVMRAVGAMKRDIVFFFACENLIVSGSGAILGIVMAISLHVHLSERYGLAAPTSALVLVTALGMMAVSLSAVALTAGRAVRRTPMTLFG
ncbi:FtsX-like permease family protein [Luteibacter sp. 9133]|uniref:ABC transporter permease n=1 Tax=Luteibacter sp. 9133 TaxID=1500891 RepID=UPI00068982B7|nr:FtsX-like permease family protein [Luteibacter sp. 9133]